MPCHAGCAAKDMSTTVKDVRLCLW